MKKKRKLILGLGFFVVVVILSMTACTPDRTSQVQVDGQTTVYTDGRFVETEIDTPEGMGIALTMIQFEDGTIRAMNQMGALYDSVDGGATWNLSETQFDVFRGGEHFLSAVALNQDGSAFVALRGEHLYIDSEGNETWVEVELHTPSWFEGEDDFPHSMVLMTFTSNNMILGRGWNWEVLYLIEPSTGEIILNIGELEGWPMFDDVIEINGQIIVFTSDGFEIYSLETGGLLEVDLALQKFYEGQDIHFDGTSHLRLFLGTERDTFYIVTRSGLYRHTLGGSEVNQVIEGAFNTMSNTTYSFGEVIALIDNRFLVSYLDREGRGMRLMDYTFSTDVDAFPTGEMTVFSLFNDPRIRQAVSAFQSQNPDLLVRYEVGIVAGDSGMTVSDAISTLNTQILAGSGPDVLFLDGMPYEAYIENGILLEITDLVAEIKGEEEFFENILGYKRINDQLFTVPTYFFLPLVAGPPELLGEMGTLSSLADLVETLRQEDGEIESIIGYHNSESLIRLLIHYSYLGLFNEDGTMDREALEEFLTYAERIRAVNMVEEPVFLPSAGRWWESGALENLERDIGLGLFAGISRDQVVNMGTLMHIFVFDQMIGTHERLSWDYQVHGTFIPMGTFGINSGSETIEESKEFLRFLLSREMQSSAQFSGFPVNVSGLEARKASGIAGEGMGMFNAFCPEEGEVFITVYNASVAEVERFIGEIRQVTTPSVINRIILDAMIQDGVLFLDGEQTLEEAVEGILMRMNLFLAE